MLNLIVRALQQLTKGLVIAWITVGVLFAVWILYLYVYECVRAYMLDREYYKLMSADTVIDDHNISQNEELRRDFS